MRVGLWVRLPISLPLSLALTLSLVPLWSAVADAATAHHRRVRHHLIIRPDEQMLPPAAIRYPGFGPIPPSENRNLDPSTRGSG
ncbi:hypothetical protein [Bradyrhizobium sp. Ce-3]|uniref:hypothetical protein n=1 Tax=Bradyrhizobium sp. Ce-3 TaxID=2913970 RepID=UPI001FBBD811|nr:hypothetical protein [Bradyrhizobium sp. Ce-3]GKQ50605.1 hypothetical protein BRSPCE3_14600 [Bradyrhizobium sp. Ce-3]